MAELNISSEHYDKFKFYIHLPSEIKEKFNQQLSNAPVGLSPSALVDFASKNISNLSLERIKDIFQMYFNIIRAKDRLNVSNDEFIEILRNSLAQTGEEELNPTENVIEDFRKLLYSSHNTLITIRALDVMTGNQNIFLDAKVYQDLRPIFNDSDEIEGSVIIHNLKIKYRENGETKEMYFSLDNNDLENIVTEFKKTQDKLKTIKTQFEDKKLIEIK